jgi:phage tail-like protein
MPARDANDATWYVLRYAEDFSPRPGADDRAPFGEDSSPFHDGAVFYDPARHVLELVPEPLPAEQEIQPPPGLAVDINGEIYRVDPATHGLRRVRCDGSEVALPCEPHVFARPAGLALDRRGFLYVADRAARRVVVVLPDDGSVHALLGGGFIEPVDVAVAPDGRIFVADRGAGRIEVFSPHWRHLFGFASRGPAGLPATPRPIAILIDADGAVVVADASHPRLLRFARDGTALAEVPLSTLVAALAGGDVVLDALARAYGARAPRFLAAGCCPLPDGDGGVRLAAVHGALRLLRLALGRRFAGAGVLVSAALDAGAPATIWHRIEIEADLPAGTAITVETLTADDRSPRVLDWQAPRDAGGRLVPFRTDTDQLVQSSPGRFLWLRITLTSDGGATPSLRAVRVFYPRVSYLALLPPVYQRDAEAARFLQHFLALFEHVFTGVEDRYQEFSRQLDLDAAPRDILDWLAALVDLAFDPSWPLERRRALLAEVMSLYAIRGTPRGIERYIEIYTGIRPLVMESFLERPGRPAFLGRPGALVGCGLPLVGCAPDATPDATLYAEHAHRFRVYVYLDDPCREPVLRAVIDRIVEVNKPAHTAHELCLVYPGAQVGMTTSVGIGWVVGAAEAAAIRLGGCDPGGGAVAGGVLGENTIVGDRRGGYLRQRTDL